MSIVNRFEEVNPRRRRYCGRDVGKAKTIDDLRHMARRRLPNFLYEYIEGGAEEEWTLRNNRAAFYRYRFLPHALRDVSQRTTEHPIFNRISAQPLAIAPTGFAGFFWPDGDVMLAKAAVAAGVPMAQSTVSNARMRDVAAIPGLRHWAQFYVWGGPDVQNALLDRAECAGSEALVVTVDGPISGNREWDQRSYAAPDRPSAATLIEATRHPRWWLPMLARRRLPNFENLVDLIGEADPNIFAVSKWINANQNPALCWRDLERIRARWPRKLVIKGLLRTEDAVRAADLGADAIVLSNHGGRQAEPAVSPLEILPGVRAAVGDRLSLFLDSGVRRGSDIAIALALGADAVLVGRATLYGLAAGGEPGVRRALEILRTEFDRALALIGVTRAAELDRDILLPAAT
ncbi:MAG: alpha-hydroxy-acid oxidizing protein [Rhodospirillales bacterium]|nr:alpha-hydroxy-acid oxidizing protein [Rhodospirillales bacterium]